MTRLLRAASAAAVMLAFAATPASADPNDYRENRANKIADCDKKLREAQSRREYREKRAECNRELAKFDREYREKRAERRREHRRDHYRYDD